MSRIDRAPMHPQLGRVFISSVFRGLKELREMAAEAPSMEILPIPRPDEWVSQSSLKHGARPAVVPRAHATPCA